MCIQNIIDKNKQILHQLSQKKNSKQSHQNPYNRHHSTHQILSP